MIRMETIDQIGVQTLGRRECVHGSGTALKAQGNSGSRDFIITCSGYCSEAVETIVECLAEKVFFRLVEMKGGYI